MNCRGPAIRDKRNGSWLFTLDHSLLPGGAANEGDQIEYFILAQDQSTTFGSPNIQSSPAGQLPVM